jgi:hypothetical protein
LFLEFLLQDVVVSGFPCETVPILRQHHRDAPGDFEVSYTVQAGSLKARAALAGVGNLLEYLVTLAGRVSSKGFDLLS